MKLIYKHSPNDAWLKALEEDYSKPDDDNEMLALIGDALNEHQRAERLNGE